MPEATTTTGTVDDDTTATGTITAAGATDDGATGAEDEDAALEALQQLLKESGLKPEQLKGRLEASRKWEQRAKSNAAAAQKLAELERSTMSDAEKIAEAHIRAAEAELSLTRFTVAAAKGLPASAAQFLYGDDEDEINSAADDLLAFAKTLGGTATQTPAPDLKQGRRGAAPGAQTDPNAWFRGLARGRNTT